MEHHLNIALFMDFFYVNGNIFLHTKSDKLNFISAQHCTSRSLQSIIASLEIIQTRYSGRLFNITDYHADNEFDKAAIKYFLVPKILHVYGRNEHVGPIERSVRTIKESLRSTCHSLPFKRFTRLMTKNIVEVLVEILNSFPKKNGI